jgi:putative transposase
MASKDALMSASYTWSYPRGRWCTHRGYTPVRRSDRGRKPPQVVATGPNQVFSWDITWLHTSVRGIFLFAYVIIDIFDRTIVGWEVHDREDEQLARDLFARLSKRLNLKGAHVHSDNGNPMKGLSLLGLLYTWAFQTLTAGLG